MPAKKKRSSAAASRLTVLAANGDDRAFLGAALEMLASGHRLSREAAIGALAQRPLPAARTALREMYLWLDQDGPKRDQSCEQRELIVRSLRTTADLRDTDIGVRAQDCHERLWGEDIAYKLRAVGLMLVADTDPELLPYLAIEHLDDIDPERDIAEPAATAFTLLAAGGHFTPIYQWLRANSGSPRMPGVLELFADANETAVERFLLQSMADAVARRDDAASMVMAEIVLRLEIGAAYGGIAEMMQAKIGEDLYAYLAMMLARADRPALTRILERELHRGRRPAIIVDALKLRTTDTQAAVLKRWEAGEPFEED
jgi:hypothetical protein